LPPISTNERCSSFTALPTIENSKHKSSEKLRIENAKSEKNDENKRGKGEGNTSVDEVTTVKVRRRIIISDYMSNFIFILHSKIL
jgi:hypothetical protein